VRRREEGRQAGSNLWNLSPDFCLPLRLCLNLDALSKTHQQLLTLQRGPAHIQHLTKETWAGDSSSKTRKTKPLLFQNQSHCLEGWLVKDGRKG
jgi:hypothetical protein